MYGDWATRIAKRVQRRFDEIDAHYNFALGDEFEIAVAEILREILPTRAGVCRGFVVTRDGLIAGDDIVVFDRVRFPTMRLLGDSLALKEQVPLEAVLAYIEAKHTLCFASKDPKKATFAKACQQIRAVRALPEREQVSALQIRPYMSLRPDLFVAEPRPGFFDHSNPLYCVVLARRAVVSDGDDDSPTLAEINSIGAAAVSDEMCCIY